MNTKQGKLTAQIHDAVKIECQVVFHKYKWTVYYIWLVTMRIIVLYGNDPLY
jgi:hypothetical protein